ncbi:hypothetical protein IPZ58_25230 [Streptomyces roseoverticillatus]|nr:hypothetical protein [Streptomyces roseoverticillatus]
MPQLYCPIPPAIGENAEALNEHAATWLADNRLYATPDKLTRHRKSEFGTFAARTCPHPGIPLERMKLYTEWLAFGFYYDDQFMDESTATNEAATVAEAVIAMISSYTPAGGTGGALVYAHTDTEHHLPVMRDLLERTAAIARPDMFERLRTHMMLWWYSYLYEPLVRASGHPVGLAGFCANRVYNIASLPYVTVAQIVADCLATAEDLAHPHAVLMGYLAAYEMGWCNDIHSGDHETKTNTEITHLPGVLAAQGLTLQQAMAQAAEIHDGTMRAYLQAERAATTGNPHLADYARVLRAWIRGHYDWCRDTHRYMAPLASAGQERSGHK